MQYVYLIMIIIMSAPALAKKTCGSIAFVSGTVTIRADKSKDFLMANVGDEACSGDYIVTGEGAKSKIVMPDTNEFVLGPNSGMIIKYYRFKKKKKKKVLIQLAKGQLRSLVKQKYASRGEHFEVQTTSAVAGVRGTDFITEVSEDGQQTEIMTFEGEVAAFDRDSSGKRGVNPVMVKPGFKMNVAMGQAMKKPRKMKQSEVQRREKNMSMQTPLGQAPQKPDGPPMLELQGDEAPPVGDKKKSSKSNPRESFERVDGLGQGGDKGMGQKKQRRRRGPHKPPKKPPGPPPGP